MKTALTRQQRHVFDNLERIVWKPYLLTVRSRPVRRYQLDDQECTLQITGLVVRGYVAETADGHLTRLKAPPRHLIGLDRFSDRARKQRAIYHLPDCLL